MRLIDNLLNKITMYRLVLYYLIVLAVAAAAFSSFGMLPLNPLSLAVSTAIILAVCWGANRLFAWAFDAQTNAESFLITGLILALIITPPAFTFAGVSFLIWASIFAMASKYILAIRKKHLFNPAAFAVALTALALNQYASWWVGGNLVLLPFVLAGGLLVVRKLQRFDLVFSFLAAAAAGIILTNPLLDPATAAEKAFLHTSILFFAFVMLTEPLTTPPTRSRRILYGAFVGAIFSPAIHVGSIYATPELALLAGNVFSYLMSPKAKYSAKLKARNEIGINTYEFIFETAKPLKFSPGQYMEWTLGQDKADSRGNRRYFTIASSPTETGIRLGIKCYEPSSSYKKKMLALQPGDTIVCGQLAGDFTLPADPKKKLAFLAGGIGVTPFRSMAKYIADRGENRSVNMIYANKTAAEICYADIFNEAIEKIGMKITYVVTSGAFPSFEKPVNPDARPAIPSKNLRYGPVDATLIAKEIPDYLERTFYLSGPRSMVVTFEDALHRMGVPRNQIRTDFFPGFA